MKFSRRMTVRSSNPFRVFTPEDLDTQDTIALFVEVPYLDKVQQMGNTMLNGPRGSGKSMLFRYLTADCQMIVNDSVLKDLPFFGILISIKKAADLTELRKLTDLGARAILGEHALSTYVAARLFEAIASNVDDSMISAQNDALRHLYGRLSSLLLEAGDTQPEDDAMPSEPRILLERCRARCESAYSRINQFAKRLAFGEAPPYEGPLCDYLTFLLPLIKAVKSLPFMPSGAPVFLMFDDADHLGDDQTRVLNSWLVARTQGDVGIKVATQLQYKTFATISGAQARPPHDFQKIDMLDVYTTKKGVYLNSVEQIVEKRLRKDGIESSPSAFFPPDHAQEARIEDKRAAIRGREARGYRIDDDVLRYARPEYIRDLGGLSKSTSTFVYAGFAELVHLSSGQVRYFLEPAARMFEEQRRRQERGAVTQIDPKIQNSVVREDARMMFDELDERKRANAGDLSLGEIGRLQNLIRFLGGFFYRKLVSDQSERRIFSVAVTGGPEEDVETAFRLGVDLGYFHPTSIGNKEGTGRVRLYVLTRRLAPYFNLDPSSFAGYQFFTNNVLRRALADPDRQLATIKRRGFDSLTDDDQSELF